MVLRVCSQRGRSIMHGSSKCMEDDEIYYYVKCDMPIKRKKCLYLLYLYIIYEIMR